MHIRFAVRTPVTLLAMAAACVLLGVPWLMTVATLVALGAVGKVTDVLTLRCGLSDPAAIILITGLLVALLAGAQQVIELEQVSQWRRSAATGIGWIFVWLIWRDFRAHRRGRHRTLYCELEAGRLREPVFDAESMAGAGERWGLDPGWDGEPPRIV